MFVVKGFALVSVAFVSFCSTASFALAASPSACQLPLPPVAATRASIFSPQQEQWLGHAEADLVEPGLTLQPESASAYVSQIGERLVAALPPTPTPFSFQVFESDNPGAFALAGGRVYISRKLLLDARNADEVAAMLAHEIGRAYIHHSASLVTLRLEKLLNVRSVGNQDDIVDKLELLLNVPPTEASDPKPGDRDKDEMLADRVALYVLIKAGYVPEALASFLDRNGGDPGIAIDIIDELFDFESDPYVRGPQAHKVYGELPVACRNPRPQYRPGFKAFQDTLRDSRIDPTLPPSAGLNSIALTPPMNPALLNVRLSPNAKYVLAQDESQIHVLGAKPLKLLFSIDARGANMAQFTPDSKSLAFSYPGLRVENWDVASQQRAGVLDWVDYDGCTQSSLSPDGTAFACLNVGDENDSFQVTDLSDGRIIYQNSRFPKPYFDWQLKQPSMFRWSQDGHSLICSSPFFWLALDLKTGTEFTIQDPPGSLVSTRIQFVDSNHLLYSCRDLVFGQGAPKNMCFAAFPGGDILDRFNLDETLWMAPVTRGPHVLVGPYDGAAARVLDVTTGNLGQKFKLETVDLSGDTVAYEADEGGLAVGKLNGPVQSAPLPVTPIRSFEAAAFSADGHYLAVSDRARGAVWDLTTGKRLKVTHPFRAAAFNGRGELEAIQSVQELKPAGDGTIDRETSKPASNFAVGAASVQFGDVIVWVKPHASGSVVLDANLNVIDAATKAELWSKSFSEGLPRIFASEGGRMLLLMPWESKAREEEVGTHKNVLIQTPDFQKKRDKDGLLIEVVDSRTGVTERLVHVPTVGSESGAPEFAVLFGNLLAVEGAHNNTTVYRETDGARLFSLFGTVLAGDGSLGLIAARNRPQELSLYSAVTGNRLGDWTLDSPVLAARIIPEKKLLLALTALEHVYRFDLPSAVDSAR